MLLACLTHKFIFTCLKYNIFWRKTMRLFKCCFTATLICLITPTIIFATSDDSFSLAKLRDKNFIIKILPNGKPVQCEPHDCTEYPRACCGGSDACINGRCI